MTFLHARHWTLAIFAALLASGAVLAVRMWLVPHGNEPVAVPAEEPSDSPTDRGPPWFEDRTRESGIDFIYRNGEEADQFTILESLGGGVALLDYDSDGLLDILATGGGTFAGPTKTEIQGLPTRLFRNLGNWKFQDATAAAGLERTWAYTHGLAVADFDRDGWPDFVVTGYGRIQLFRNVPDTGGRRRFEEVSKQLNLVDDSWSTSAGWADVNGDGWPDLYVCHYVDWSFANNPPCNGYRLGIPRDVCAPQRFKPLMHSLFLNEKGRGFREVGAEHGFKATGCGLGVVLADVNDDGRPDIYVANDASDNFLFLNRSGKLTEVAWRAGVAGDEGGHFNGSMGTDAADFDGTGRASIWVTNFQGEMHALYRNLGRAAPNEAFDHHSRAAGVAAVGGHYVGFGTAFLDADGDGWEDIAIVNGHVIRQPTLGSEFRQKPILLRNIDRAGRRVFEDVTSRGGTYFRTAALGRGLAVGDLDNDGRPDLVVSHTNSPLSLLRNLTQPSRWVGVRLKGQGHRDTVGSTLTLESGTRKQIRFVKGGGSYLSAADPRILFRIPDGEAIGSLTVKWSWGGSQTWKNLQPGSYHELVEGAAP